MPSKFRLYCITNEINDKKYVGITKQGLSKRFSQHATDARRGSNTALARSMRKHGVDKFKISPLGEADSYEHLLRLEKEAIISLNTKSPNGYNLTYGGDANWRLVSEKANKSRYKKISKALKGRVFSPDERRKISAAKKGKPLSDKNLSSIRQRWSRPVVCVEENKVFNNGHEVIDWLISVGFKKAGYSSVVSCCKGKKATAYGYRWKYLDGSTPEFKPKKGKEKEVYSPDIPSRVFGSVTEAKDYMISLGHSKAATSAISKAAKGKISHAYGFRWSYVNNTSD